MTELTFYIDPNEERSDGLLPISMRFTVNHGPDRLAWGSRLPEPGQEVWVYSDGDRARFRAMVERPLNDEAALVRVKWETIEEDFEFEPINGRASVLPQLRFDSRPNNVTVGR